VLVGLVLPKPKGEFVMSSKKSTSQAQPRRHVALCYVRLSVTQTEDDENSPERQIANCQEYCDFMGWKAEFYKDAEGHKSGTQEETRPQWLKLKTRIADPDVVALVANDLSRFHRKGFRMGQLVELCKEHNLQLVKAGEKKSLDINDITVTMWIMMEALFNEYYAEDIARKMRDSVRFRRSKGIVVGGVPFGTIRPKKDGKSGFLIRSNYGVWLLEDGSVVKGKAEEPPPEADALWRGFADAAECTLRLYAGGQHGLRAIAELVNQQGFYFRDVNGHAVPFSRESVRGVIANWVEYGGAIVGSRARNRRAKNVTVDSVVLNPERAIFDIALCYQVGKVRQERSRDKTRSIDNGVHIDANIYPLSKITFCAHCDRLAKEKDDPKLKTYLTGLHANRNNARYRHKEAKHKCSATNRSVLAELIEADFARLVSLLAVRPEAVPIMARWLAEMNKENNNENKKADILAEINYHKQRMQNSTTLFRKAYLSEAEWAEDVADCEHQIMILQSQLSENYEVQMMLELTAGQLSDAQKNWHDASSADRQAFAHNLFEEIIYDLDTRRITAFKLKPWAESFLQLRVGIAEMYGENPANPTSEQLYTPVPLDISEVNNLLMKPRMKAFFSLN
jgi:DNA invertase Pin-like site-specific DNA recombinase/cell division septum initiation protein DivIVA